MAGSDPKPRARPSFTPSDSPPGRPRLPSAQESREAQYERTERLRALRQDFLEHAQTKVKPQRPRNIWIAIPLTGVLLVACIAGAITLFQLRGSLFSNAGESTATQFMASMQQKQYQAAYANCTQTVQETFVDHSGAFTQSDFVQQAQTADQVGPITSYALASSSSTDANDAQYIFNVTRKTQQSVKVTIGVAKQDDGSWKISSIGNTLFPTPPPSPTPTPTSNLKLPGSASLALAERSFL